MTSIQAFRRSIRANSSGPLEIPSNAYACDRRRDDGVEAGNGCAAVCRALSRRRRFRRAGNGVPGHCQLFPRRTKAWTSRHFKSSRIRGMVPKTKCRTEDETRSRSDRLSVADESGKHDPMQRQPWLESACGRQVTCCRGGLEHPPSSLLEMRALRVMTARRIRPPVYRRAILQVPDVVSASRRQADLPNAARTRRISHVDRSARNLLAPCCASVMYLAR